MKGKTEIISHIKIIKKESLHVYIYIYIHYIQSIHKVDPLLSSSIKERKDERICVCVCAFDVERRMVVLVDCV